MALNAGDAACSSGLSQRIYNFWTGDTANNGMVTPLTGTAQTNVKSLCWAIAQAVVAEIHANGAVSVSTPGVQAGSSTLTGTGTIS